ncbi:MAG TPA: phospho-N-acetylmuramoyl-pentapeptide-transferase, partial [Verrucomicrobiota bacterium]|nr:phospho-N-acetylmuramoyl-pentapeptide-transferase [Verrucomicrobiota bacterium]
DVGTAGYVDPRKNLEKLGTPTMGGLMIVVIIDLTTLVWAQWSKLVLLTLFTIVLLCMLGFIDDFLKLKYRNTEGVRGFIKLYVQGALTLFAAFYLLFNKDTHNLISEVMIPFIKEPVLVGTTGAIVGVILTIFVIVGTSNAVNLTDGMDGLAIGCVIIVTFVFLVITYVSGNAIFAKYLQVPYVPGSGELTVFCSALIGAGLGFLWFNCYPAMVFMGDTGSLALGGVLGMVAVLIHQPIIIAIAGGIFLIETVSVIIQRSYFKYTKHRYGEGRRVFKMAPIHHHFQKLGWKESQIVTRFYVITVLFAVLALATLKIR